MRISDWSSDVCSSDLAFGVQLHAEPAMAGGRCRPQIDDDVEDAAAGDADQLGFGVGGALEMQSAQRAAPPVPGDAALAEPGAEAMPGEFLGAPAPGEEADRKSVV